MHVIKREEKDKRKRQEGREERMNKQKSQVKVSKVFVFILYQTSEHRKYFPTIQPLEINSHLYSHLSLVNALPIN